MKQLGSRMKLWHIADRGTRLTGPAITPILKSDSVELGTGNMPLDDLWDQAEKAGYEAAILESHRNWIGKSPIRSFCLSANYLRNKL